MFNNRFNSTKKDPLVEAIQTAMQDGEIRRQAEALVNEEFGVYSRKALVREDLAAYDARLEEAYKCMKEGETSEKKEKKKDDHKDAYSKMREKMVGKGTDRETTKKIVGEAKKLADKDYDKDGKVESPKDEVWGSRFRAAKMAGKMEEEQIDELKKPTAKTAMQAYRRAETHDDMDGNWNRSNRLYRWKEKNLPGKSARNQKPTGKAKLPDVSNSDYANDKTYRKYHFTKKNKLTKSATKDTKADIKSRLGKHTKPNLPEGYELDEAAYSAKAARAGKDIGKPGKEFQKIAKSAAKRYGSEERGKKVAGAILAKIRAKHMKEENLEELSQFGSAFAAARKSGQTQFSFGGKSYSTAMKGQGSSAPKTAKPSGPENNPGLKSATGFQRTMKTNDVGNIKVSPSTPGSGYSQSAERMKAMKAEPTTTPGSMNISSQPAPTTGPSGAEKMSTMSKLPSAPAAPAPSMSMSDPKAKALKESVQVGENKYRIV